MLTIQTPKFYKVKSGQTLTMLAQAFCVSEYAIVKLNRLTAPPAEGEILQIPAERGNVYTVCEGDTKTLLCGNEEKYEKKNGSVFYLGQRVIL